MYILINRIQFQRNFMLAKDFLSFNFCSLIVADSVIKNKKCRAISSETIFKLKIHARADNLIFIKFLHFLICTKRCYGIIFVDLEFSLFSKVHKWRCGIFQVHACVCRNWRVSFQKIKSSCGLIVRLTVTYCRPKSRLHVLKFNSLKLFKIVCHIIFF